MSTIEKGVNLQTGKLSVPLDLVQLTGPNGFGAQISAIYTTNHLMEMVRGINEFAQTGVLGLGWGLNREFITRIGNGSYKDQFLIGAGGAQPLILESQTTDKDGNIILDYRSRQHSNNKYRYISHEDWSQSCELWIVTHADGSQSTYGGKRTWTDPDSNITYKQTSGTASSVETGVRWLHPVTKAGWIGTSTVEDGQVSYTLMWNLATQRNPYGQQVEYTYAREVSFIGKENSGLHYTTASYLTKVNVVNGACAVLRYAPKVDFEYPPSRVSGSSPNQENAYQDRVEEMYLSDIKVYNYEDETLITQVTFEYDFLFNGQRGAAGNKLSIQKRMLTGISQLNNAGQAGSPKQRFDYWGLNDGVFNFSEDETEKLLTDQIYSVGQKIGNQTYGAILGHLKSITSPKGSTTFYSYSELEDNADDYKSKYKLRLDLPDLPFGVETQYKWGDPKPYWGNDNFVVIRYLNTSGDRMCLVLYEWLGSWVRVKVHDDTQEEYIFGIDPTGKLPYEIVTGNGIVAILRTNTGIAAPIWLWSRSPSKPGHWDRKSMEHSTIISGKEDDINGSPYRISLGNNVLSILDIAKGWLYCYALIDGEWIRRKPQRIFKQEIIATHSFGSVIYYRYPAGLHVEGNVAVVFYIDQKNMAMEGKVMRIKFDNSPFNPSSDSPWIASEIDYPVLNTTNQPCFDYSALIGVDVSLCSSGFQLGIKLSHERQRGSNVTVNMITVFSWNDETMEHSFDVIRECDSDSLVSDSYHFGQGSIGEIIDSSSSNKFLYRYKGGDESNKPSDAWESCTFDSEFNDPWSNLLFNDFTVGVESIKLKDKYYLYNFDPVTLKWIRQLQVEVATNVKLILELVNDFIQLVSIALMATGFLAPEGSALMSVVNIIDRILSPIAGIVSALLPSANLAVHLLLGFVDGIVQSVAQALILRSFYSGRRGGLTMGTKYLVVAKQEESPTFYYNKWDNASKSYKWYSLGTYKAPYDNKDDYTAVMQDTFTTGNAFVAFSYGERVPIDGAFNNDLLLQYGMVAFFNNGHWLTIKPLPEHAIDKSFKDFSEHYTSLPFMLHSYYDDDTSKRYLMNAPWGGILGVIPKEADSTHYYHKHRVTELQDIHQAKYLGLFMAHDMEIEGPVSSFVVDKVVVDDGFQQMQTHFRYKAYNAIFDRGTASVHFNQVNIATGAADYDSSLKLAGERQYFFYNGGIAVSGARELPHDPIHDYSLTDGSMFPNAYKGSCYAVLFNDNSGQTISKKITKYKDFALPVNPNSDSGYHSRGLVPVLITSTQDGTTSTVTSVYDIPGADGATGQNTAFLLTSTKSNFDIAGNPADFQSLFTYGFQVSAYSTEFLKRNFLLPVVQSTELRTEFNYKSSVQTWAKPEGSDFWMKAAPYLWRGSDDGQLGPFNGWLNGSPESDPDWVKGPMLKAQSDGVVLETVNTLGKIESCAYGKNNFFCSAVFENGSVQDYTAFYCGFEAYENTDQWSAPDSSGLIDIISGQDAFTGQQSICLSSATGTTLKWTAPSVYVDDLPDWPMFGFYYKNAAGAPNDHGVQVMISVNSQTPSIITQAENTNGEWKFIAIPYSIGLLTQKYEGHYVSLEVSFYHSGSPLYLDNIYMRSAYEADLKMAVFDKERSLITASMDSNGLTTRFFYDQFSKLVGTVIGKEEDQQVSSLETLFWSRSVDEYDDFDHNAPNGKISLIPQNGGAYHRYLDGNPRNWQNVTISGVDDTATWQGEKIGVGKLIVSGGMNVKALHPHDPGNFGIRFQLVPRDNVPHVPYGPKGLELIVGDIALEYLNTRFTCFNAGKNFLSPVRMDALPGSWLFFAVEDTFYLFADNKLIFASHFEGKTGDIQIGMTEASQPSDQFYMDDILIFEDPIAEMSFFDGEGKLRQTQKITSGDEVTTNPTT